MLKKNKYSIDGIILMVLFITLTMAEMFYATSYVDEVVAIISMIYLAIMAIRNKTQKIDIKFFALIFVLVVIGLISNVNSNILKSKFYILVDVLSSIKCFAVFLGIKLYSSTKSVKEFSKMMLILVKVYVITITLMGIVSFFVNTGMYGGLRFGIPAYRFIFHHAHQYNTINFCAIYILLMNLKEKRTYIYVGLCLFDILISTKGPALIFVMIFILLSIYLRKRERIGLIIIIPIVVLGLLLGSYQVNTYLRNIDAPRYLLWKYSIVTANKYFPLGSGFGTYGSDIAAKQYSTLYIDYGFNERYGMNQKDTSFLNDSLWPMAIGQFGYFGFIIYITLFLMIFKLLTKVEDKIMRAFSYALMMQYLIHGIGSAILTSSTGVIGFFILGMILCQEKKDVIEIEKK